MARRAPRRRVIGVLGFSVMLVVDPRKVGVLEALAEVRAALPGERIAVQLRMKGATDSERIVASRALAGVSPIGARLLVNGSVAVARAIAADGVHLPEAGGAVLDARAALREGALVGCSCHDAVGVERRAGEGADYLLLGPLGDVPGKSAMRAADFRDAVRRVGAPVLALGGIATPEDARRARDLGACGVAIERGMLGADGPALVRASLETFAS